MFSPSPIEDMELTWLCPSSCHQRPFMWPDGPDPTQLRLPCHLASRWVFHLLGQEGVPVERGLVLHASPVPTFRKWPIRHDFRVVC